MELRKKSSDHPFQWVSNVISSNMTYKYVHTVELTKSYQTMIFCSPKAARIQFKWKIGKLFPYQLFFLFWLLMTIVHDKSTTWDGCSYIFNDSIGWKFAQVVNSTISRNFVLVACHYQVLCRDYIFQVLTVHIIFLNSCHSANAEFFISFFHIHLVSDLLSQQQSARLSSLTSHCCQNHLQLTHSSATHILHLLLSSPESVVCVQIFVLGSFPLFLARWIRHNSIQNTLRIMLHRISTWAFLSAFLLLSLLCTVVKLTQTTRWQWCATSNMKIRFSIKFFAHEASLPERSRSFKFVRKINEISQTFSVAHRTEPHAAAH